MNPKFKVKNMFDYLKPKLINGHTKAELERHNAGKFIENPEKL